MKFPIILAIYYYLLFYVFKHFITINSFISNFHAPLYIHEFRNSCSLHMSSMGTIIFCEYIVTILYENKGKIGQKIFNYMMKSCISQKKLKFIKPLLIL